MVLPAKRVRVGQVHITLTPELRDSLTELHYRSTLPKRLLLLWAMTLGLDGVRATLRKGGIPPRALLERTEQKGWAMSLDGDTPADQPPPRRGGSTGNYYQQAPLRDQWMPTTSQENPDHA